MNMAAPTTRTLEATRGQTALLVFVALAMALGGASNPSSTGPFLVQMLAILFGLWALLSMPAMASFRLDLPLTWMIFAWLAILIIDLLPLPPSWWSLLPGRGDVRALRELLQLEASYLPLSLDPPATVRAFLASLPLAAMAALAWRSPAIAIRPVGIGVIVLTLVSFVLGAGQILGGPQSPLYLYAFTNRGMAVGFFANANHLGTLYLVSIPVFAALATTFAKEGRSALSHARLSTLGYAALMAVGIYQTGSVAGALLLLPTTGASLLVFSSLRSRPLIVATLFTLVAGLAGMIAWSAGELPFLQGGFGDEKAGRWAVARITLAGIAEFWPVGSGLGTFREVFPMFENPATVTSSYRNHAHNDYLEVVFECGAAGILLVAVLLTWFGRRAIAAWRDGGTEEGPVWRRAASIVIAVILAHSLVDYPLRTPAHLVLFGFFMLVLSRSLVVAQQRRRS